MVKYDIIYLDALSGSRAGGNHGNGADDGVVSSDASCQYLSDAIDGAPICGPCCSRTAFWPPICGARTR